MMAKPEIKKCNICGSSLSDDPKSIRYDCGGDCMKCMADIFEDPECIAAIKEIEKETK